MRWACSLVVLVGALGTTAPLWADDQEEGLKLVNKAIQAAGGEARLAKLQGVTLKGKGAASEGGQEITFEFEGAVKGLDKFKLELNATVNGMAQKFTLVVNGDKGWAKAMDKVEEAPKEVLELVRTDFAGLRLAQMLVALKDKGVMLSPLGEIKVGDKPALGLKVKRKDQPEVDLFFDKDTSLPVKFEVRVREPEGGQDTVHEFLFSDYKELAGVKHFTKVTIQREGKKLLDAELTELKADDKLDENLFAKP